MNPFTDTRYVSIIRHFHFGSRSRALRDMYCKMGNREWTFVMEDFPDYKAWKAEIYAKESIDVARAFLEDGIFSSMWVDLKWMSRKLLLKLRLISAIVYKADDMPKFSIRMGVSVVNPADQFSKKAGLKLALERMMPLQATPVGVAIEKNTDITVAFKVFPDGDTFYVCLGSGGRTYFSTIYDGPELHTLLYGAKKDVKVPDYQG